MKIILRVLLGLLALVVLLGCYVGVTAGRELLAVRALLDDPTGGRPDRRAISTAKVHVRRAHQHLTSLPAKLLGLVPVARQNIAAGATVTDRLLPVLDAAGDLEGGLQAVEESGLWKRGAVDLPALRQLSAPLDREADALDRLLDGARAHRSGWLLPPVWDRIDRMIQEYESLADTASSGAVLLNELEAMLGVPRQRTYLILLINNAELRGAGGILSGVGSIKFSDGRMSVGRFFPVHHLREKPYEKVEAPRDFERRFGVYKADTTLWLNATFSPDLPDVALVASRLFERTTGTVTDGALVLDPRGVQALARPETAVEIEPLGEVIERDRLASFVYSDVYARFSDQNARRVALLEAGRRVFEDLKSGDVPPAQMEDIGDAVAGGHLRMVSFDEAEQDVLDDLDVAGELRAPPEVATIHVTEQNLGSANGEGTKLDYWAHRRVGHTCDVSAEEATCSTELEIHNRVPAGLGEYVGGRPYGILRGYLEVYVPQSADLVSARLDDEVVDVRVEDDEAHRSVGAFATVPAGERVRYRVTYKIPVADDGLQLELRPQPLARDAELAIAMSIPDDWRLSLDGKIVEAYDARMTWRSAVRLVAEPDPRSGLPALWERVRRFWTEPL